MADSSSVRSRLQALMQDHLGDRLVSTLVNTMPAVYFMLGDNGNKEANFKNANGVWGVGRFNTGFLFSGIQLSKAKRESILNSDKYMPAVMTTLPAGTDSKFMGQRDRMPTVASWDTVYPASWVKRPFFKWAEVVTPIKVPKKDIRRTKTAAGNEQKASNAIGDMFRFATEASLTTHMQIWNEELWGTNNTALPHNSQGGQPTNYDAEVWDGLYSFKKANLTGSGTYAGIDRSASGNSFWNGKYDSTTRILTLEDLVNDACYTKGISKKGQGAELVLCNVSQFPAFASEAKAKGGQVIYSGSKDSDSLPDHGEFGFKRPVIRFNNTWCTFDPECPANTAAVLNLATWTVAVNPNANFEVDEPFDQSRVDNGDDAITSNIRTELIVACEAPSLNVYYDGNVG